MTNVTILAVRIDTKRFCEAIELAKSKLKATFLESNSVESALAILTAQSIRAVLCDSNLPENGAQELFFHLEKSGFGDTTFFILDELSQVSEADKEKMIVLQGANEIHALWEHLEFIGINVTG